MRVVLLFIVSLATCTRPLIALSADQFGTSSTINLNLAASSSADRESSLLTTPLDPLRSACMYDPARGKNVLAYLRDMMELCRSLHRHELVEEYSDAWELAATRVYGALPPRKPIKGHINPEQPKTKATPAWKSDILARPYRKVIAHDGDSDILECGHRTWHTDYPESSHPPKRRRCRDCSYEVAQKKQPASATPLKKVVTA